MTKPPAKSGMIRKQRCAIYTRKSSEEGLEQEFNSLHAQREACEAYIASQRSEGWVLVRDQYDDGGISGGTLERPGLKRLLEDIEDGLVDSRIGRRDRRERQLTLTDKGAALERRLSESQRARMRAAYRAAGPQAVTGFRQVLEAMMDGETRAQFQALRDAPPTPGEVGAGPRG